MGIRPPAHRTFSCEHRPIHGRGCRARDVRLAPPRADALRARARARRRILRALRAVAIDEPSAPEHQNVARVRAYAAERGTDIAIRRFPSGTRTAEDAARAIGVQVGQIVKSLVFVAGSETLENPGPFEGKSDPLTRRPAVGPEPCAAPAV